MTRLDLFRMTVAVALAVSVAGSARAMRDGAFGASGAQSTFRCTNCHNDPTLSPTINVDALTSAVLRPGDDAFFALLVQRAAGSAGLVAGFGIATDNAGTFVDPFPERNEIQIGPFTATGEATHRAPKAYDAGGLVRWDLQLQNLTEGRHHLFVGVNDANDNRATAGDHAAIVDVIFLVCDPDGPNSDTDSFVDACDVCPDVDDEDQVDSDGDGVGDACDVCPDFANADQADADADGIGDACDEDTDDCALGLDTCNQNATCTDGPFRTFSCACNEGFEGDGFFCANIDECSTGTDDCAADATCTDTPGSFTCACNDGYDGDGVVCADIDECAAGTDGCDDNARCDNDVGTFTCTCADGFTGDGVTCDDIDECLTRTCGDHSQCENLPGSSVCLCDDGYQADGDVCVDVDECDDGSACTSNQRCDNTDGSFTCTNIEPTPDPKPDPASDGCNGGGLLPAWGMLLVLGRRRRSRRA